MFDDARNSASILEERKLLQQIIYLGVGYLYGKSWCSNAAICDMYILHCNVSKLISYKKYYDMGSKTHGIESRIRIGEEWYYIINFYIGCVLSRGKHPIEDIIINFTIFDTNDDVQFRWRKGARFDTIAFLIAPEGVFLVWENREFFPLSEFHMISFISSGDKSKSSFVVDYDAAQNKRPLVLFPSEENSDIIQAQLNQDDRCRKEEYESILRETDFYSKKSRRKKK